MSKNDATDQQHFQLNRAQVLKRLWEIANLSPEMTRNSITGQVKALSMIVAIESLIPDRRAAAADKNAVSPPDRPQIYRAAWLDDQEAIAAEPEPDVVPVSQQAAPPNPSPSHIKSATPINPPQPSPHAHVSNMARVPEATGPYFPGRTPSSRRR
jgi:hypothetical protein